MSLDNPRPVERSELFATRPRTSKKLRLELLWVAGSLEGLAGRTIAVVGSRAPSEGGRSRAREIGRRFAQAGVCVISGLALGVDGAAHVGALDGGGLTIGVLGGGHRHFFPRRNRHLAEAIVESGGAVISPYPPDEPVRRWHFLQRNGVVAALADAVVIVEAAARSGALNTAGWAGDLSLPVFAFPGDVDRPKAAGCNALIRDGTVLVRDAADVLDDLGWVKKPETAPEPALPQPEGSLAAAVFAELVGESVELDRLIELTGAPTGDVLAVLFELEMAGWVERRDDSTYARAKRAA